MLKKESYIKSSYDELVNKVSWPSWSELQSSSIVVAIASLASYKSNNPQEWVFINPPNSQLDNNIYLVRGPPILL